MKRRGIKKWLFFCSICVLLFIFRRALLLGIVKIGLSFFPVAYEKAEWEDEHIRLDAIHFVSAESDVFIDQIDLGFSGSLFSPELHCTFFHPQIQLKESSSSAHFPWHYLLPSRLFTVFLEIYDGVIALNQSPSLYFSVLCDDKEAHLGSAALSYEPSAEGEPLLTAEFEKSSEGIAVHFTLQEADSSRLLPIASAFIAHFPKQWTQTHGEIAADGYFHINRRGDLIDFSSHLHASDIAWVSTADLYRNNLENRFFASSDLPQNLHSHSCLASRQWSLAPNANSEDPPCQIPDFSGFFGIALLADRLDADVHVDTLLSLDQIRENLHAKISCERAQFHMSSFCPYSFLIEQGAIFLEPKSEPLIDIQGVCQNKDATLAFNLKGTAEMPADDAFLMGMQLQCWQCPENILEANMSICRYEQGKYAIQVIYSDLLPEHLHFFASCLPAACSLKTWNAGTSRGTLTLLYDETKLRQISLEALQCENCHFNSRESEHSLIVEKMEGQCSIAIDDAAFLHFDGQCLFTGVIDRACSQSCAVPIEGKVILASKDNALIATADLRCDEEKLSAGAQFHCKDSRVWEFVDGWFETEGISEKSYGAFFPLFTKDVILKGTWQLTGSIDPSYVVISAQSLNCSVKNSLGEICIKRFKDNGVECIYSFEEKKWQAEIPLQEAYVLDAKGDLLVSSLDASIQCDGYELTIPSFSGKFKSATCSGHIDELSFTPSLKQIAIQNARIECSLSSEVHFLCRIPHCIYSYLPLDPTTLSSLDAHLFLQRNEAPVLELAAKVFEKQRKEWDIRFSPHETRIFGLPLHISSCRFSPDRGLECEINGCHIKSRLDLTERSLYVKDFEGQYKGMYLKAAGELDWHEESFALTIDSFKGNNPFPQISYLKAGSAHGVVKGTLSAPMQWHAELVSTLELSDDLNLIAWNSKPFKIDYRQKEGYRIDDLSMQIKNSKGIGLGSFAIACSELSEKADQFSANGCSFQLHAQFLTHLADRQFLPAVVREIKCSADTLEGSGEMRIVSKVFNCRGALKEGRYGFKEHSIPLKHVSFQCERGVFTLQAKAHVGDEDLWGAFNLAQGKNPQGIIRITSHPQAEGLRFFFKSQDQRLLWEKIQGSCAGLSCSLTRKDDKKFPKASVLTGTIDVDGELLSSYLQPELKEKLRHFKVGKGYSYRGDLVLEDDVKSGFQFHMNGEITGEDWELLGYRFKHLRASLSVHPQSILLSHVQLEDDAGSITIKQLQLEKKPNWELSIPLISVREWRPSSMKKVGSMATAPKPFTVRNFTLSNIHAILNKEGSLQGRGKLTFTNQCKKESTLLDTPLEMIKNFGLDPGLLTPVQGDIELDLQGDKLYLISVKDAFSEARRSEFYLAPGKSLSYIDLDGKMHIDLKMRQDVMLKLTEPFILTIRGSLDNPRYGLQF